MKENSMVKKEFFLMIITLLLSALMQIYADSAFADVFFYVSPNGSDSGTGTKERPFASIERARDAIREQKRNIPLIQPVTVYIGGGRYELDKPLVFTPEDSGTKSCPVIYRGLEDKIPVISGGRVITGWEKGKDRLWTVKMPEVKTGEWTFRQLYVNGKYRKRPRLPKEGYYRIKGLPDGGGEVKYNTPAKRFEFNQGDIDPNWKNLDDVEIVVLHFWVDTHLPIKSVDTENSIVNFRKKSRRRLTDDFTDEGARYYVDNVFEAISGGEWYLDRKKGMLYYKPLPDEDMKTAEVIAPFAKQLVLLTGKPQERKYVEHIKFQNLSFMHTNFDLGENDAGDLQAANSVPSAIHAVGLQYCEIEDCTLTNLGTYAIRFADGCRNNIIRSCEISHLAAGGIRIGAGNRLSHPLLRNERNSIIDNHIAHLGEVFHSAVGVWIGHAAGCHVSHNEIDHVYYTGISVGWNWGYDRSPARDNIIEYNHVHHIGQGMLSDMGGCYLLGIAPGTVIRNNLFHDIDSHGYGGWGIYTDEGSSHVLIENNIVYNTKTGGFNQHFGRENIIRNNIFAFSKLHQISRGRAEPHKSFFFENNIVYWETGPLLSGNWEYIDYIFKWKGPFPVSRPDSLTFEMDYNIYWNPMKTPNEIMFDNLTFEEWKARRQDIHSIIADPLFIDAKNRDFRLKPDSPALNLGFKPIDISNVGPRNK